MTFFGASRYPKAKEIYDAGLASNSAEMCRRGAKEIQQLIDEEWADGTGECSIIPFRSLRNKLNDRAEELDKENAWRKQIATMEAKAEEEARRRAARKRETSYHYDPFYRSPIEKRLWEDDFDDNSDFFNGQRIYYTDPETGERSVWGYDSMSS